MKQLDVGPYAIHVYEDGIANVTRRGGSITWIEFPTAKAALDWVRFQLFGPFVDPIRAAGEWITNKYRNQIRAGQPERAALNMAKQGVPVHLKQFITEGA
jgi:hypothetical protein